MPKNNYLRATPPMRNRVCLECLTIFLSESVDLYCPACVARHDQEDRSKYHREYYQKNLDKINARNREYQRKHYVPKGKPTITADPNTSRPANRPAPQHVAWHTCVDCGNQFIAGSRALRCPTCKAINHRKQSAERMRRRYWRLRNADQLSACDTAQNSKNTSED